MADTHSQAVADARRQLRAWARPRRAKPALDQPLERLDWVVFDTETAGWGRAPGDLPPLIGIAAVKGCGTSVGSERFVRIVNPGRAVPDAIQRLTGISQAACDLAPPAGQVVQEFARFAADGLLVAHHAPFDVAVLQGSIRAAVGVHRLQRPVLDTGIVVRAIFPSWEDLRLEALVERLGIRPHRRHDPLGDALMTARLWVHCLKRLELNGVLTLGELYAFLNLRLA